MRLRISVLLGILLVAGCRSVTPLACIDADRVRVLAEQAARTHPEVSAPFESLELNAIQADFVSPTDQAIITVIFWDRSSHNVLTRDAHGKPKKQSIRMVRVFLNNNGRVAGVHESVETFEEPEWKNY